MPTGTPIYDIREQLFEAAERVLERDGPDALTSRAVTTQARVAKGILHRHFPDFEAFLAAYAMTHLERLGSLSTELRATAGTATVPGNLAHALATALNPTAVRIISLICSRRGLLARLRLTTPTGIPVAVEVTRMVAAYLTAERGLGRIAITADIDALAVLLVGGVILRATDNDDLLLRPEDLLELLTAGIDVIVDDGSHTAGPAARTPSTRA